MTDTLTQFTRDFLIKCPFMHLHQTCNCHRDLVNTFFPRANLCGKPYPERTNARLWHPHLPCHHGNGVRAETGQTLAPWLFSYQAPCSQCLFCGHCLTSDLLKAFSKPLLSFPLHLRHTPAFSTGFGCPISHTFTELLLRDAKSKDF